VRVVRVVHVVRVASWRWILLHTHYEAVCCSEWQRRRVHMKLCTLIATANQTHSAKNNPFGASHTHTMAVHMRHVCVCDETCVCVR